MPSSRDTSWHLPLTTPRLALSAGTLSFPEPAHGVEHNEAGLKLVLVLGGQLDYQLQSGGAVHVEGPAFHISLSDTPFVVSHRYAARQPLQYLSVRMPMAALHDTFGAELDALARRIAPATRHAMATANGRAGKTLQALGRQIMLYAPAEAAPGAGQHAQPGCAATAHPFHHQYGGRAPLCGWR